MTIGLTRQAGRRLRQITLRQAACGYKLMKPVYRKFRGKSTALRKSLR
jgi:hypothetical protein